MTSQSKALRTFYCALVLTGTFWQVLNAGNWPNFRGPNFNGSNTGGSLPVYISKTDHLEWQAELSGLGSSTPAVWNKSVFVTAAGNDGRGVYGSRIDLYSGKILWSHQLDDSEPHDFRSGLAGSSPTTDGQLVIFMTGSGKLSAYRFDGELAWQKDLQKEYGEFSLKWTYSSSPVLFDGSLYLQILQRNESIDDVVPGRPSLVVSLDPINGKEKWKQIRRSQATAESLEAYSSPIPIIHKQRKEILVSGADCLTGHNPENGKEIWRWESWNRNQTNHWRTISSPVYGGDMIVACAPKAQPAYTFFAGSSGTVNHGDLKWKSKIDAISCDVTTPLFYQGHFYFLNGRKKVLSCVEPYSGKIVWSEPVPARSKLEASPSAADGKIYVISHTAEVLIFKSGTEFELLHSVILGQDPDANNRSTIVPAQGRLLIRVGNQLWCMD